MASQAIEKSAAISTLPKVYINMRKIVGITSITRQILVTSERAELGCTAIIAISRIKSPVNGPESPKISPIAVSYAVQTLVIISVIFTVISFRIIETLAHKKSVALLVTKQIFALLSRIMAKKLTSPSQSLVKI